MTIAKTPSPATPHRGFLGGGSRHFGMCMAKRMLGWSRDTVTFDKVSTGYRGAVLNRKHRLVDANVAPFASSTLSTINVPEGARKRKLIVASRHAYE